MDRLPIRNTTGAKPCSTFGGVISIKVLQPLRSNAHHDIQQLRRQLPAAEGQQKMAACANHLRGGKPHLIVNQLSRGKKKVLESRVVT